MVLAQKQTYGSMKCNRESRNKLTQLWIIIFGKEGKNIQCGEAVFSASNVKKVEQAQINQWN